MVLWSGSSNERLEECLLYFPGSSPATHGSEVVKSNRKRIN
jgi:hypothetical protein